ncbi:MAG: PAS domain S-box-containing protein [Salibacteraceae bacterium]|jgi:PAS domain S-box-containing protein
MNTFLSLSSPPPIGFEYTLKLSTHIKPNFPIAVYSDSINSYDGIFKEENPGFSGILVTLGKNYQLQKISTKCWHLHIPKNMESNTKDLANSHLKLIQNKLDQNEKHTQIADRFEMLSNLATEGLVFHKAGIIKDLNTALVRMFDEKNSSSFINRKILDFVHPSEHDFVISKLNNPIDYTYESIGLRHDGSTFPCRIKGKNQIIGDEVYRFASIIDLTDIKITEEKLRISSKRLSLIAKSTGVGHFDWVFPDGKIFWNNAMHGLFDLDINSCIDRNDHFYNVIHPQDKDRISRQLSNSLDPKNKETLFSSQFRIITKSGTTRFLEALSFHERENTGQVTRIIGVCSDISKRKIAEQALKDSEAMLKLVVNAIPQNVYWKDKNSKYLGCNEKFSKLVGYKSPLEVIGKTDFDISRNPEDAKFFINWDKRILKTQKPEFHYLFPENDRNGNLLWIEISKVPIKSHKNEIIGTLGTFEDVTHRVHTENATLEQTKKLETTSSALQKSNLELNEALVRAQKSQELELALKSLQETQSKLIQAEKMASVGILSAGMAHEINNPLNFIQGGNFAISEFIDRHISDTELLKEAHELVAIIAEGVSRTSNIVSSLNRFSRTNQGDSEVFNLHKVINNCLTVLQNQLKFKVTIHKKYDSLPANLTGNEGELHQVILNILHNSEQAIKEKGAIEIESIVSENQIFLKIKDTGEGIEKSNLEKITDPFFTTKPPGLGTGLGMSISYNIITKHEGTITYKSEKGNGCEVILIFNI